MPRITIIGDVGDWTHRLEEAMISLGDLAGCPESRMRMAAQRESRTPRRNGLNPKTSASAR